MVALVEAAQNYEDRGYGFATYASMRIRGSMIDHIRKISNICRSAMALQKQVKAAEHQLSQELGRAPSEIEIAAALNMDIETFREQYDRAQNIAIDSMDEVYSDHNMWFADVEDKADDVLERKQMKEVLAQCIGKLKEREAMVLAALFCRGNEPGRDRTDHGYQRRSGLPDQEKRNRQAAANARRPL